MSYEEKEKRRKKKKKAPRYFINIHLTKSRTPTKDTLYQLGAQ